MKKPEIKPFPCLCGNQPVIDEVKPHTHSDWLKQACPDFPDGHGECFIECWNCSRAVTAPTREKALELWNQMCGISHFDLTVMVFALRYAISRHSYAPSLVCEYIKEKLPRMTDGQREQLQRELEEKLKYKECADNIAEYHTKDLLTEVKKLNGKS